VDIAESTASTYNWTSNPDPDMYYNNVEYINSYEDTKDEAYKEEGEIWLGRWNWLGQMSLMDLVHLPESTFDRKRILTYFH